MNLIPTLHQQPEPSLRRSMLGWLMRIANRHPLHLWYENKSRMIAVYGEPDGFDLQTVDAACWECGGGGVRDFYGEGDCDCPACDGTGIHHRTRTVLHRFIVGGNVFHQVGRRWYAEDYARLITHPDYRRHITGRVKHRPASAHNAREALGCILLLCGFYRSWWRLITTGTTNNTLPSFPADHFDLRHPQHCLAWLIARFQRHPDHDIPF